MATQADIDRYILAGRRDLIALEEPITRRLVQQYEATWKRIEIELQALERQIAASRAAGAEELTVAWLRRQTWYGRLQSVITSELERYHSELVRTIATAQQRATQLSLLNAEQIHATIGVSWEPTGNLKALQRWISATQPGSPLAKVLAKYGPDAERTLLREIGDGILQGMGSGNITKAILKQLTGDEMTPWQVATISRTETMRAYRGAFSDSMAGLQHAGIVQEYEWMAAHDERTCIACLGMDGSRWPHPIDRFHVCCRCVSRPVVDPRLVEPGPKRQTGEEWLGEQDPLTHERVFGNGQLYELWAEHGVPLREMVGVKHSDVWGPSVYIRSALDVRARLGMP